jgi:hypothetical protein
MPEQRDPIPTAFEFCSRSLGLLGSSINVCLRGAVLVVESRPDILEAPEVREETPSRDDWAAFVKALDNIDAWSWEKEYSNPAIDDGEGWKLRLEIPGRKIDSEGRNAYPGEPDSLWDGIPLNWPQYHGLLVAVGELIREPDDSQVLDRSVLSMPDPKELKKGLTEEDMLYFRDLLSGTPVMPWSEWWSMNSARLCAAMDRGEFLRLKLRGMQRIKQIIIEYPEYGPRL